MLTMLTLRHPLLIPTDDAGTPAGPMSNIGRLNRYRMRQRALQTNPKTGRFDVRRHRLAIRIFDGALIKRELAIFGRSAHARLVRDEARANAKRRP